MACGTHDVELLSGQCIPLDPESAYRLDRMLASLSDDSIEEVHKLCLSITDSRGGQLYMPNRRWVDRFNASLGNLLRVNDLQLVAGAGGRTLFELRCLEQKKPRRRVSTRG
jgi:hypothetical protein